MPDILHKVGVKSSSLDEVYRALATVDGLAGWWTDDTTGESKVGEIIHFRFGTTGGFDMKVIELAPGRRVLWEVVDGPAEWIGTRISFDLKRDGDYSTVLFKHQGWREATESMHHCSTKWGTFLMSLKSLLETCKGAAYPNDVLIDNWR